MAYGVNDNAVRLKSGGKVSLYSPSINGGVWANLGIIMSGKIDHSEDATEITPAHGAGFELPGKEKCTVEIVLGQSGEDETNLVDLLTGTTSQLLLDNGVLNGKRQLYVVAAARYIKKHVVEMKAANHQTIMLSFSAKPLNGVPDNFTLGSIGWTGDYASVSSKNPYYAVITENTGAAIDPNSNTDFS